MINVTKTFLPPFEEYTKTIKRAWDKSWITNNGELVQELEQKLKEYLGTKNLLFCGNGTIAIQIAIKALGITGDIITTPFSYVATTNSILWESCKPIFVDINNKDFCIDASAIEKAITPKTQAILATQVYGNFCDVEQIDLIAKKHSLKVIYDAAHGFGTKIKGKSILNFGDVSTCSFHATKLFHTVEGGCVTTNDDGLFRQMSLYRHFGHVGDEYFSMGINGKNSEMHAAMGLCNLKYIDGILEQRKKQWFNYHKLLHNENLQLLSVERDSGYNFAYFPVVFSSEGLLINILEGLRAQDIVPRRYFYPSLNTLPFVELQRCPIAEDIARRVLCLPLFHDLTDEQQRDICEIVLIQLKSNE